MFSYIPAGLDTSQEAPTCIYCRYGNFGNDMKVIEQNSRYLCLQLPDRILTLVQDNDKQFHTKITDWDECLPISPFHKTSDNIDFPQIAMINYTANYGKFNKCAKSCKKGKNPNRLKLISDSGGFQVAVGRVDYIDTANLAKFYNENADLGIVLDVPLYNPVDLPTLKYAAQTQKKNTEKLLDNLDGSVELLNVCHGYEPDKYRKYLDIVDDERIDRLCIGGLNTSNSIVASLSSFITIVSNYKHRYKHFHILGIYNPALLAPFIYLAENVFPEVLITSDSSTALQSARSGMYHLQREFNRSPERLLIGSITNNLTFFNPNRLTCCQCPVCSAIKYMDVYSFMLSNPVIRCLTVHNILEIYRSLMSQALMSRNLSFSDFKKYLDTMFSRHSSKSYMDLGMEYVETYLNDGLDAANKRYSQYFSQGIFSAASMGSLVSENGTEVYNMGVDRYKKQVLSVLKKYNDPTMKETFKLNKSVWK